MFWIHGGCFVYGSAAGYDGAQLAQEYDMVVVVVQYRLGAFGFLGGDALRSRDPARGSTGNWGLLDNLAALQWVQANGAAFGGDPKQVTIFGESSGAGSVSQLLGVPSAWPYFQRAIMESGAASFWTYLTLEAAASSYDKVVQGAGCAKEAQPLKCLLASGPALTTAVTTVPCRDGCNWAPTIDGTLISGKTIELARAGKLRPNTPIISGFNLHDGAEFVTGYPYALHHMTEDKLERYFRSRYGEERVQTLQGLFPVPGQWPTETQLSPFFYAAQRCETDFSYACSAFWLTATRPSGTAFVYQFSHPSSKNGLSLHGDEIPYVFGTVANPTPADKNVERSMMTYWTNFARTGDPNGRQPVNRSLSRGGQPSQDESLLRWPAWTSQQGAVLNITASPSIASVPLDQFQGCSFFDEHWDFYGGCLPPSETH